MLNILYNISQVLGITIIHSLWQGLAVYFILRTTLLFSANLSSSKKYWLAVSSLLTISGWFAFTLVKEVWIYNWLIIKPAHISAMPLILELPSRIQQINTQTLRYYYSVEAYLPYITTLYVTGLLFNASRLVLARKKINAIRRHMSIAIDLQQQLIKFIALLNIKRPVVVGLSKLVDVPCMVGYFKPVILLPFTLATYLSAEEIEAILLHELSHLKRNDYLINLLQQVLSILLFFNPSAQLINRIINEERENCCDDLVVNATADPLTYAKALLKLEQTREQRWQLSIAATGKKYHLLNRIQRIMKTKNQTPSIRPALLAMLILTVSISTIALLNPEIAEGKISLKAIKPAIVNLLADTGHKIIATKKAPARKSTAKRIITKKSEKDLYYIDAVGNDKKLNELNAEIQKHSEAVNSYYNSDAFKQTQQILQKKQIELQELYNNPELKKLEEEDIKIASQYKDSWNNDGEIKKHQESMSAAGKNIGAYFSSPDFKKLNEGLQKKYGIAPGNHYYDDRDSNNQNYKKYKDELQSQLPARIKEKTDQLKKDGERLQAEFNSPKLKEISKRLSVVNDSLIKKFGVTNMSLRKEEMEKLSRQMAAYQHNPNLNKELELLKESVNKMTAYINSHEYKKHLEELKRQANSTWLEHIEKPEQPEKPEAPEKKEKQEN